MKRGDNLGDATAPGKECGARTRSGAPCRAQAMTNGRCRLHGGASPGAPCGPRHGMYRHGLRTKAARAEAVAVSKLLKDAKALLKEIDGG